MESITGFNSSFPLLLSAGESDEEEKDEASAVVEQKMRNTQDISPVPRSGQHRGKTKMV